jgi:CHRD domain
MSRSHARGLCAATLTLAAAVAHIGGASAGPTSTVVLKATLTGPYLHTTAKGTGTATITFYATKACWKFTYNGIDPPNISGIHQVPPPPAGYHKTSVFPFTATTSTRPGCEALDRWGAQGPKWAAKIVANPGAYYVIIGTGRYPNGGIGGVLHNG